MAVKSPVRSRGTSLKRKLRQLAEEFGQADDSVQVVTFDPEQDVLAVFVDAAQDKSQHEKAVIGVWIEWLMKLPESIEFHLLNFSEMPRPGARESIVAAHLGEVLLDRR